MKSVLHLRTDAPGFSSESIKKGFVENGYTHFGLDWQRERFSNGVESMREKVITLAQEIKPDIIFCHIQNEEAIDLKTWKILSEIGFVINYSFDVRSNEQTKWMYDLAKDIGFTFFGCQEDMLQCVDRGIYNTSHIHSSCDMDIYKPHTRPTKYTFDVSFCGNNYVGSNLQFPLAEERQKMISFLDKTHGSNFGCYGIGQKGGIILPGSEASLYRFSKMAVCQNNFIRHDYSSDRLWRIMATGTLCLCQYFPGLEKIFSKELNIEWWDTFDELKHLIDYYLSDDNERESVAAAGCDEVRIKHTWTHRIREIEKIVAGYKKSLLLV